MVPSISQQLRSLRATMAETIIPALPAEARFAHEQAGLMVATLDWLDDVQAHAYRYEAAENADYRALVAKLQALAGTGDPAVDAVLAEPAPPAAAELVAFDAVATQNRALKEHAGRLSEQLAGDASKSEPVGTLLRDLARRQGEREAAWFRMTGFPHEPGALEDLLTRG